MGGTPGRRVPLAVIGGSIIPQSGKNVGFLRRWSPRSLEFSAAFQSSIATGFGARQRVSPEAFLGVIAGG